MFPDAAGSKTGRIALLLAAIQALLILALVLLVLDFPNHDIRVPLRFSYDSLQFQVISKGTVENGWWWSNPRLSAPFGFPTVAYPVNGNIDQLMVWAISRFSREPGLCINVTWFIMVAAAGVLASSMLRLLGVSRLSAFVFGTLYAFLPYSLYRNIDFFHIVTWLLPFPSAAALAIASTRLPAARTGRAGLVTGCVLVGLDYIYNAFFSAFLFLIASIFVAKFRNRSVLTFGAVCLCVVCGCAALNLVPSFVIWAREGKPVTMFNKVPAESETYGLKIRHLVSPLPEHTFGPFKKIVDLETEAQFPLETENVTARLGLVPSMGFLFLLVVALQPRVASSLAQPNLIPAAAQLNLACVLLATIGGFGSLFNLLVAPDIRAYNRLTPFIGFFSLAALADLADRMLFYPTRRTNSLVRASMATAMLAVGLWDQCHALRPFARSYSEVASEYTAMKALVSNVENVLPEQAMVYQLPFSYFLGDGGVGRMGPYDQARPYLVSKTLRWSFPAMSNRSTFWGRTVSRLEPREVVSTVRAAGFSALFIDRFGYDDNGEHLVSEIEAAVGKPAIIASDSRHVIFDIRGVAALSSVTPERLAGDPRATATTVDLPACPAKQALGAVDQIGSHLLVGWPIAVPANRAFEVRGWAVWRATGTEARSVDVAIDGLPFGTYYGIERVDVVRSYGPSAYRLSGYLAEIGPGRVSRGLHNLALRVVAPDGHCYDEATVVPFELK